MFRDGSFIKNDPEGPLTPTMYLLKCTPETILLFRRKGLKALKFKSHTFVIMLWLGISFGFLPEKQQ